jgi:arylsulfatase A
LFFHYPHYYPTTTPVSAIRKGQWKLLECFEDGRRELYDLSNDLAEQRDFSWVKPEVARNLAMRLREWRNAIGAQEPEPNPAK